MRNHHILELLITIGVVAIRPHHHNPAVMGGVGIATPFNVVVGDHVPVIDQANTSGQRIAIAKHKIVANGATSAVARGNRAIAVADGVVDDRIVTCFQ